MNYDNMSFAQAFAAAHDAGDDVFTWKGKQFKTNRKDGKSTNARKQSLEARRASQRPAQVSHTYQPRTSHREAENAAPVPPPYPQYEKDGRILRTVKENIMKAHNAGRYGLGMEEIFPDAQSGYVSSKKMGKFFPEAFREILASQDFVKGQDPQNYNSMGMGELLKNYFMRQAMDVGQTGMGMTGMYQAGRAMQLNNMLKSMASQPRIEPYLGAAQKASFLPFAPD